MRNTPFDAALLTLVTDRADAAPLYVQLYEQLRELILSERLAAAQRLPATRTLADELGVSRTTVVAAYDQLRSEGYIDARRGSGAFVANVPPDHLLSARSIAAKPLHPSKNDRQTDLRPPEHRPLPFSPGAVDQDLFPTQLWSRLLDRAWRRHGCNLLNRSDARGHVPLQHAISEHLKIWRAIDCDAEQIFVTSGSAEGLRLVLSSLLDKPDRVFLEDPGYDTFRRVVADQRHEAVCCPVDGEGLDIAEAERRTPNARAAIVTASRHYPLGVTMSLARRLALLDWAKRTGGWIIEDDYDSEYRYAGRPLATLMSLDETERVIYLGSFSKVLFPTLRLGYVVAPRGAVDLFTTALRSIGSSASMVAQPALAEFIESGAFASHIRRMRRVYGRRLVALRQALDTHCQGLLEPAGTDGGMHIVARLSEKLARDTSDIELSRRAHAAGLIAPAISSHAIEHHDVQGLVLGFAAFQECELANGVRCLASVLTKR